MNLKLYATLLKKKVRRAINRIRVQNNPKIFCIGKNKTGTTSLKVVFEQLNFVVGEQDVAEHLFDQHFLKEEYQPILNYCRSAEVFQDVPFSFHKIIPVLDKAFPGSKFILTVRDSEEQWYNSFVKYYSKRVGADNNEANYQQLSNNHYVSKTFRENFHIHAHNTDISDPFNKETLIDQYVKHNNFVREYFKNRDADFIEINVAQKSDLPKLLAFIGKEGELTEFPWSNKT